MSMTMDCIVTYSMADIEEAWPHLRWVLTESKTTNFAQANFVLLVACCTLTMSMTATLSIMSLNQIQHVNSILLGANARRIRWRGSEGHWTLCATQPPRNPHNLKWHNDCHFKNYVDRVFHCCLKRSLWGFERMPLPRLRQIGSLKKM